MYDAFDVCRYDAFTGDACFYDAAFWRQTILGVDFFLTIAFEFKNEILILLSEKKMGKLEEQV